MMNDMESKTVLVTGGSGFIGSAVCRILADAGHNVINIDPKKKEQAGVTQYPFSIDNHQVAGLINLVKPETIIHLAAEHEVGRSMTEPGVYYANNVANTITLLNHAVDVGVKHFIFSSSSSVYGETNEFPTSENATRNPVSPYGLSKKIIEDILPDYEKAYGIKFASLRYFNAAGALPDNSHGYVQDPATHLIPNICRQILEGETVTVYGGDYNTSDGTGSRDYTHVSDIALAHIVAMNYLSDEDSESGYFNLGSGQPATVLEVIKEFEKITGETVKFEIVDRRPGDAEKNFADPSLAMNTFGWHPQYALSDIIEHAWNWAKKKRKK